MRNFLFFYAFIFKIVSSTGKLADKEKLIRFDEVASVIKLWGSVGSGCCWFVYQIHPPTIDTLVTGMVRIDEGCSVLPTVARTGNL